MWYFFFCQCCISVQRKEGGDRVPSTSLMISKGEISGNFVYNTVVIIVLLSNSQYTVSSSVFLFPVIFWRNKLIINLTADLSAYYFLNTCSSSFRDVMLYVTLNLSPFPLAVLHWIIQVQGRLLLCDRKLNCIILCIM